MKHTPTMHLPWSFGRFGWRYVRTYLRFIEADQVHPGNLGQTVIRYARRRFGFFFTATASSAVQSNWVYPPQEALDDFKWLGLAADKRS